MGRRLPRRVQSALRVVNLNREQSLVSEGRLANSFWSRFRGVVDGLYLRYYGHRAPARHVYVPNSGRAAGRVRGYTVRLSAVGRMRARLRRMWPDERGQSLVEMALVLPLLLLLLAGIIDLGRAFNNYIIITNAAREGARYGSRYPIHDEGIILAVEAEASESGVLLDGSNVGIDPEPPAFALAGDPIVVTVTYQFDTILGGIVGAHSLMLASSAEMIVL